MIPFRFQQRDCIEDCNFDLILIYFQLKLIVIDLFLIKRLTNVNIKLIYFNIN